METADLGRDRVDAEDEPRGNAVMVIETVNLHIVRECNLRCTYCFGTFPEAPRRVEADRWYAILEEVARAGVRRVNFSGGEPTLHPDLLGMLRRARGVGLETSVITNGVRLTDDMLDALDLVGISLDSADQETLIELGRRTRADSSYVERMLDVAERTHRAGARLKVNTVVTIRNVHEEMTGVLLRLRPWKWKPLQFTHVPGENDESAPGLCVAADAFAGYVERHRSVLEEAGVWVAAEAEEVVRSTYVMIDPGGCVFRSGTAGYIKSDPVQEVGLARAVAQVGGYDRDAFVARRGYVSVSRLVRRNGESADEDT